MSNACAAIDIGTNTMLLLIAETRVSKESRGQQIVRELVNRIDYIRLGEGVRQRRAFIPEAMERARRCFLEYAKICRDQSVEKIYAVATSASRNAKNASEFYTQIFEQTGISVQIIPGDLEAKLSFYGGLLPLQNPETHAVMDIGGGSTEFVVMNHDRTIFGQSIEMGCVSAAELYLKGDPYSKESLIELESSLKTHWTQIDLALQDELRKKDWVGVAGTPTTCAGLILGLHQFEATKLDGFSLDLDVVRQWYKKLCQQMQSERLAHPLIGHGRADVIVPGTAILKTAMEFFNKQHVLVSTRGLRHGVLQYPELLS